MAKRFLVVELVSGEKLVTEFERLGNVQRYVVQVFARVKPLNVWRLVGMVHPVSGENCRMRTLMMLPVEQVKSIVEVEPAIETHGYDVANFTPVAQPQSGEAGAWVAPNQNTPEGAVAGVRYPVHRDANANRYVILHVAGDGQEERRFWLDSSQSTTQGLDLGPTVDDEPDDLPVGPLDGDDD